MSIIHSIKLSNASLLRQKSQKKRKFKMNKRRMKAEGKTKLNKATKKAIKRKELSDSDIDPSIQRSWVGTMFLSTVMLGAHPTNLCVLISLALRIKS